jgi:two-component system C4-dicarboxylate transport response regulator DctD
LCGHEGGAFAGGARRRVGRIEQADRGTLFLAEVESLPSTLQARLMGVLQQRMVEPLGADEARPVDVRVVAATDTDLAEALGRREFRDDLFYRLSVATVRIPPLRDRREDIPLLYEHFASRAAKRFGREPPVPTPETMRFLLGHSWPGNIRELARFAERMVLGLGDGATRPSQPAKRVGLAERVEAFERGLIVRELAVNNGDTRAAAEALEIPRKTLYDKLSRLGIDPRTYRGAEGAADRPRAAPPHQRSQP